MQSQPFHVPLDQPSVYRIVILGVVEEQLLERLGDLRARREWSQAGEEISILTGYLPDQAALIGILMHLYNRGYCLLSLERMESESPVDSLN